jgi:sugar transferase
MSFLSKKKIPCLFVNIGGILEKLLNGSKMSKIYRPILYNTLENKRSITSVIQKLNIKVIIIETSTIREYSEEIILELINLRTQGIQIYQAEEFYEIINERIPIVRLATKKYLGDDIFSIRMRKRYKLLKRVFDLCFVFLILPIAIPLILLGILLTKLTSKGDVFFSQKRVGENGKIFKIRKIRTMTSFNNDGGFTQANDNRITTIGKFLRLTKIDELPQLWNILSGDMSVIGPRPERPEYVEQYVGINPFFNLRHMIKPGVSGWAQIHIPKATPEDNLKKLEYDLFYIKRYSWKLDIRVLWETFKIVLTLNSH